MRSNSFLNNRSRMMSNPNKAVHMYLNASQSSPPRSVVQLTIQISPPQHTYDTYHMYHIHPRKDIIIIQPTWCNPQYNDSEYMCCTYIPNDYYYYDYYYIFYVIICIFWFHRINCVPWVQYVRNHSLYYGGIIHTTYILSGMYSG